MISAEKLKYLTTLSSGALTKGIREAGYKKDIFWGTPAFIGITNGGQFCYRVDYPNPEEGPGAYLSTKVFVTYDPTADRVLVDY